MLERLKYIKIPPGILVLAQRYAEYLIWRFRPPVQTDDDVNLLRMNISLELVITDQLLIVGLILLVVIGASTILALHPELVSGAAR